MKISVAIATYNEEKNIGECLASVAWADEVVVVDERSWDLTAQIARRFTKKVYFVSHQSSLLAGHDTMFHRTKQKAIDKCQGEWVLSLDADERVSPQLGKEIMAVVSKNGAVAGYQVPRRNFIFGKWIEHCGWYPDYQVKLFRRGKGRYPCRSIHEQIEIKGETGTLQSGLIHWHYTSVTDFVDRMNQYTTQDANFLLAKGERIFWYDAVRFPLDEFLKRFFYWEGYRDGLHGLVLSFLQAFNRLVVFAKIWERQKFWEYNTTSFRREVIKEVKQKGRDWDFWVVATETNRLKRIAGKVKGKIERILR